MPLVLLSMIMNVSLLDTFKTPVLITEKGRECIMMTLELDHTGCKIDGNYYGKEDYFIYSETCKKDISPYGEIKERKYIGVDLNECRYWRIGDTEIQ